MYYLEKGLHSPLLAKIFAFFGVSVALLGIGTFTQVKSISDGLLEESKELLPWQKKLFH